jgi:hypothetical protein
VREVAKELDLKGAFELDPLTNQPLATAAAGD